MNRVFRVASFEIRRNFNRSYFIILVIFVILGLLVIQIGVEMNKIEIKRQAEFNDVEYKKIDRYLNYTQYGIYGFRMLMISSHINVLYHKSTTLRDLEAFIDTGVRLSFSTPQVGALLFQKPTGGNFDFSWYLLFFGSLIVSIWCFLTFKDEGFLNSLVSFSSVNIAFWGIFLSRIILLIIAMLILLGAVLAIFFVNRIILSCAEILGLFLTFFQALVVYLFLIPLIAWAGMNKKMVNGGIIALLMWAIILFVLPEAFDSFFALMANKEMKSRYRHEMEKTSILMEFEKKGYEKMSRYKDIEQKKASDRREAEHYWKYELKKIVKIELIRMAETEKFISRFQYLSSLNPVSWYKSVNNELSSKGYNSLMSFYRNNQNLQKRFLRYYFDNKYYRNYSKVIPFLSKGENVFHGYVSLPEYYAVGIFVNMLFVCLFFFLCHKGFKKMLFPSYAKKDAFSKLKFNLLPGMIYWGLDKPLKEQLLSHFSGVKSNSNINLSFSETIFKPGEKINFRYFPTPEDLPEEVKVMDILRLFYTLEKQTALVRHNLSQKKIKELSRIQKIEVLSAIAELCDADMYVYDNILTIDELVMKPAPLLQDLLEPFNKIQKKNTRRTQIFLKTDFCLELPLIYNRYHNSYRKWNDGFYRADVDSQADYSL